MEVRVLDNLSTGCMENLDKVRQEIHFKQGDIRDVATLQEIMSGVQLVFHQAAVVSVPRSVEDPVETAQVNDLGTLNVLETARRAGGSKVICASSCAVYGDTPQLPKREQGHTRPLSPYAASKLHGETYARLYHDLYGLKTVCPRYFNVYGPRQDPTSPYSGVISIFMDKAVRGEVPTIFGDGEQYRDFVYVADVVEANLLAARRENICSAVLNIGTGNSITVNGLWQSIAKITGARSDAKRETARTGDIRESVADISRAQKLLDFEPHYSLEEGLQVTWEWYRARRG
jgi:UDP-glucose 4-epimerase